MYGCTNKECAAMATEGVCAMLLAVDHFIRYTTKTYRASFKAEKAERGTTILIRCTLRCGRGDESGDVVPGDVAGDIWLQA